MYENDERPKRRPKPEPIRRRKSPRSKRYTPARAPAAAPPPAEPAPLPAKVNGGGAMWPVLEPADDHLADDLIHGQEAIGAYLGIPKRRTEYLLQKGQIPAVRLGLRWTASKRRLTRFFQGEGSEK